MWILATAHHHTSFIPWHQLRAPRHSTIKTLSITTLSINSSFVTRSIKDTQHNKRAIMLIYALCFLLSVPIYSLVCWMSLRRVYHYVECRGAQLSTSNSVDFTIFIITQKECPCLLIVVLNVVMLSVIMLNVVVLN